MVGMTLRAGPADGEWTLHDLDRLPDDGQRHELIDGWHYVTPAPVVHHQRAAGNLFLALKLARPEGFEVLMAPTDWRPGGPNSLQPDVLVAPVQSVDAVNITETLLLAVEVLSPGTRKRDLTVKLAKYAQSGVPSYWVVDPVVPAVTVHELGEDGAYEVVAGATREEVLRVERPFAVEFTPASLLVP